MTLSGLFSPWKNEWWARHAGALQATYAEQEAALRATLEASQAALKIQEQDLADLLQRQEARKLELLQANEDLKTQLRCIEAKAAPSEVWASAFSLGFSKAWDMMVPLMQEGFGKTYERVFTEAVEQTLTGLEPTIQRRLVETQQGHLRPLNDLLAKRDAFRAKAAETLDSGTKAKYEHYVTAIDWALEATNGH